ncbi:hypothetical protein HGI15_18540 [Modestobacter lapidis]|nr:hypothetical protein [Modestobacter lapidis]
MCVLPEAGMPGDSGPRRRRADVRAGGAGSAPPRRFVTVPAQRLLPHMSR